MNCIRHVENIILAHRLLKKRDTVLIAISGGPDSVALTRILHDLRSRLGIRLEAAHIHHGLHPQAGRHQDFVEELCRSWQIPYTAVRLKGLSRTKKGSLEEQARTLRLDALTRIADKKQAHRIALGHHRDDLAETVLMRLLRGTGLLGLQGMAFKTAYNGHTLIRPLLDLNRRDLFQFLKQKNIPFQTDPTNSDQDFLRNRIRHDLIPLLARDYNPGISQVLTALSDTARTDYDYIQRQAEKIFLNIRTKQGPNRVRLTLDGLNQCHPSLARMAVRLAVRELKGDTRQITLTHLNEIEHLLIHRPVSSTVHLPERISVKKGRTSLTISKD